jgi:hypothetical protein
LLESRELDRGDFELDLPSGLPLSDSAEVALEDYARELTGSRTAEAVHSREHEALVVAVRLRGLPGPPETRAGQDVVAFALALASVGEGGGLGWS